MELQKIINLLDTTSNDKDLPRFVTKKWTEVYDQLEKNYNVNKDIRIKTLKHYYSDEQSNPLSSNSKSFEYKTSITRNTYNISVGEENYEENKVGKKEIEIVIPLKYLSNFWWNLNIPLINSEVELILTWSKNCILADMTARNAGNNNDPPAIVQQLFSQLD